MYPFDLHHESPATQLRRIMSARDPGRDLATVDDSELLRTHGERLRAPAWWESFGSPGGTFGPRTDHEPIAAIPIEDLAPHHHIGFIVVDANGDPYPGLAYALEGAQGEEESGVLPDTAEILRDDVFDADYTLVLKGVDQVMWSVPSVRSGEPAELRAFVDGYPDGTAVEIRLFRKLRETDDDVIATLDAETLDGGVIATWIYEHSGEASFVGCHAHIDIVAELRVPADGVWAKTLVPLRLELPAVEHARWSRRSAQPGREVKMRVRTRGLADGSTVTIEVFRELRTGERECIETLEGLPVQGGEVEAAWTFAYDANDPEAVSEAECFFIVTLEDHLMCTLVSPMLAISRASGRKRQAKRRHERRAARAKDKGASAPQ